MSVSFLLAEEDEAGGGAGLEGVEVVDLDLDRFGAVEVLGLGGADVQPFCIPP